MPGYTITIEALAIAAAKRADKLYLDATGSYAITSDVDLNTLYYYINLELAALWDVLVNTYEDYCVKRKTIQVVANTEEYSMPPDFYKFRKVFPVQSGKRCAALKKFNLSELGQADSLSAILTSPIEETKYKLNGNRLWLHPVPTSAAELELWYVPQYDPIVNVKDAIDFRFPAGWEDYAIEGAGARLLEDEDSDSSAIRAKQKEILGRILIMAEDRDVGEPFQMQDTEGYLDHTS